MRGPLRLAALVLTIVGANARAEELVVSLGAERIAIRSNFNGAALSVVGVIQRDATTISRAGAYDGIVTVRGPRGAVSIWRKMPLGPLWLNLDQRKYIAIPAFISVLSNRPIDAIVPEGLRIKQRIGIETLVPEQSQARGANAPEFRAALQRLRKNEGLFVEDDAAVRFVTPDVLQARIVVPGRAPLGIYDVEVAVFADGALLTRKEQTFTVTKAGLEQAFTIAASEMGLLYGVATSSLALLLGWFASAIFRRD